MPGGPGNLAWQMPPQQDDMQRKQRDLLRSQREQASAQTGQAMQIGAGGILINNGGSLTIQGTGTFNTNGAITTAGAFTAGTSVSAGTTVTAGGNITSTGGNVAAAGQVSGNSLSIASAGSVGGNLAAGGFSTGGTVTAGGDISSSGAVFSNGAIQSPGSRGLIVTSGYVNAYLDVNGFLGYQPSTRRVKKDLQPVPDTLGDALLNLTPYLGRYEWDDEATPLKVFLIAEDVAEAGFGPDVVPLDAEGGPATVNAQNLIPVLLSLLKRQDARIKALEEGSTGAGD